MAPLADLSNSQPRPETPGLSPIEIRKDIDHKIAKRRLAIVGAYWVFMAIATTWTPGLVISAGLFSAYAVIVLLVSLRAVRLRRAGIGLSCLDLSFAAVMWFFGHQSPILDLVCYLQFFSFIGLTVGLMSLRHLIAPGALSIVLFGLGCWIGQLPFDYSLVHLLALALWVVGGASTVHLLRSGYRRLIRFHRETQWKRLSLTRQSLARVDFMANINHELRTPLNGILGMSNLLIDSNLNPEQKEYARTILSSAELLVALINDILDLARIDSKTLRHDPKPFVLRATIENVIDVLEASARDKRIFLTVEYDEALPTMVIGDSARIMQILFNLVGNAIKFTNSGGVSVSVDCQTHQPNLAAISFRVKDTGIGVADADLAFIFDRYRQAHSDIHRRFGGSGLGLTIVRELVLNMGGQVSATSQLGVGSEFVVELPFPIPLTPTKATPSSGLDSPKSPAAVPETDKPLILIADDNPTNLQLLSRILQRLDCQVISCDNGIMAFSEIRRWRKTGELAAAILDFQMPGLNGAEVVANLRNWEASEQLAACPIIVLTGHGTDHIAGTFDPGDKIIILEKPVRLHELREIINITLAKTNGT